MFQRRIWAVVALVALSLHSPESGIADEKNSDKPPQSRPELVVQTGHTDKITCLAVSADGARAISGSDDKTAVLWDLTTGLQLRSFPGHPNRIVAVAFGPGGKHILTSDDRSVYLWDAATGRLLEKFSGNTGEYSGSAAFSPDGKQVMTWYKDKTAELWNTAAGEVLYPLIGHSGIITGVAFSPNGKQVMTGSVDRTAILWDTATGKKRHTLEGHASSVTRVAFSPDGRQVVTQSRDDRIDTSSITWDAASGRRMRATEGYVATGSLSVGSSAFYSPDGMRVLLTRLADHSMVLWDVAKNDKLNTLEGHVDTVVSAAFGPGGKQLVTSSLDKTAIVWDPGTGKKVCTLKGHTSWVGCVTISPDGTRVVTGSEDKTAILWNAATAQKIAVLSGHTDIVLAVAFSPDGKRVLTGSDDKTAILWDAATGQKVATLPGHPDSCRVVAFSPDGKLALTGGRKQVTLWQAATGQKVRTLDTLDSNDSIKSVTFSPDGNRLATGSYKKVIVWDLTSGTKLSILDGLRSRIGSVVFSPDSKELTTRSFDKDWSHHVDIWDASTGQKQHVLRKARYEAFSPDGKRLLTTDESSSADMWDTVTGERLCTFHDISYDSPLTFSPDGKSVLMSATKWGGENMMSELFLCDATTGKLVRIFEGLSRGKFKSAAYSPDGKMVLTGSDQFRLAPAPAPFFTQMITWDAASGQRLRTCQGQRKPVRQIEFSKDGKRITFGYSVASSVEVDIADLKKLRTTQNEKLGFWEMFGDSIPMVNSPTGAKFAVGDFGEVTLSLFDDDKKFTLWHSARVTTMAFSPNEKHLLTGTVGDIEGAILWNAETGKEVRRLKGHNGTIRSVAFRPDGKQALTGSDDGTAILWDPATGENLRTISPQLGGLAFGTFSADGKQVVIGAQDGSIAFCQAATGRKTLTLHGHTDWITCVAFDRTGTRMASGSRDGFVRLWDLATGRELCSFLDSEEGIIAVNTEMFYKVPKGVLQSRVAFRVGDRAFPFGQFDLRFNRPDVVLSGVGLAPNEVIDAYRHAYQKRLKRMNFTEEMLSDDFHLPEIKVAADVPPLTKERTLTLKVQASDSKYLLDRLNVYVNGVPVYGSNGMDMRDRKTRTWEQEIGVELSPGKNSIQVSALNEKGAESLAEARQVVCEAPAAKPNLYVVVVGVSEYQDKNFALKYADKDAKDLADFFAGSKARFAEANVLRLLNADATRENILKVKDRLKLAKVEDQVVLFFAGHGMLDKKLDYYFCTVDIDFNEPAKRGLLYEEIEGLLDGIKARKKVLLIDTCHSGELDKEDLQLADVSGKRLGGGVSARAARGSLEALPKPKGGAKVSHQVLQEMFADLRKGTGTVVISAAGGLEFALESGRWQNGVFTFAVLEGLKNKKADKNKDGRIQVSELRDYVLDEVSRLTQGRQTPTVRRDNLGFDFYLD